MTLTDIYTAGGEVLMGTLRWEKESAERLANEMVEAYDNRVTAVKKREDTQRHVALALVVDELGVFLVRVPVVGARAVLQLGNGVGRPHVVFATGAPGVFAAASSMVSSTGSSPKAALCMRMASSAISNTPMPSTRLAVPVKYLPTVSVFRPIASKSWAPQ